MDFLVEVRLDSLNLYTSGLMCLSMGGVDGSVGVIIRTWMSRLKIHYRIRIRGRNSNVHAGSGLRPRPGRPPLAGWLYRP